jgi:type III pantothenate kinase
MDLILDIGNTRTKAAEVLNDGIYKLHVFENGDRNALERVFSLSPNAIIVSNNNGKSFELPSDWKNKRIIHFSNQTPLPINNVYATPTTVGNDRLAAAVGARFLWPDNNVLILDCGTCVTADIITATGTYLGGSISPGLTMRYQAMHQLTGSLPLITHQELSEPIGNSTETSIQSGAYFGLLYELNGRIDHYQGIFDELHTVLCGGDATYFVNSLKYRIFANQNLVLIGLNQILKHNDQ